MKIRQMTIEDYDDIIVLLQETPGVTVRDADSKEATSKYLHRNPGLSFVAAVECKKPRPEDGALRVAPGGGGAGYPQRG